MGDEHDAAGGLKPLHLRSPEEREKMRQMRIRAREEDPVTLLRKVSREVVAFQELDEIESELEKLSGDDKIRRLKAWKRSLQDPGSVGPEELREIRDKLDERQEASPLVVRSGPGPVSWEHQPDGSLRISKGTYEAKLTAPQLIRLFLNVAEAGPVGVEWRDILIRWMHEDHVPRRRGRTLADYGRRIRSQLGELGCYWHNSESGARWDPPVS